MKVSLFMATLLLIMGSAFAQSGGGAEARLLSRSSSGSTVLFNVGEWDQVKAGDFGVVMRRVRAQEDIAVRVIPVARGRVIKTSRNRSLWYLYSIPDETQLIMRDSYILTTEQLTLEGRRRLENERLKIVDEADKMPDTLRFKETGDKDLLAKKLGYEKVTSTHRLGEGWAKDGILHDGAEWVSADGNKSKYAKDMWRSSSETEFAEVKRLETFEKMVSNYLERVNDPEFNYETFYSEQMRENGGEFKNKITESSAYQDFKAKQRLESEANIILYKEILQKGEGWSSHYSDEELASMLNQVGNVYEEDRRRNVTIRNYNWQLAGAFGVNLLDNENRADSENARKTKWNVEAGAEWFPTPRHETLQRMGLWGSMRYVEDGLSIGTLNARTTEYSIALGGTWHLAESPFVVAKNIPFIMLGVRTGFAALKLPAQGETGNYTVLSFPILGAGLKYNFKGGIGLKVALAFEKILLEEISVSNPEILPERDEVLDGRLTIGLTKFY